MKILNITKRAIVGAAAFAVIVSTTGCKKKKDFSGKEIANASSNFDVNITFSADEMNPDFYQNKSLKVNFSADFSERVSWKVKVKGFNSGAQKDFSGVGSSLENVSWDGGSSNIYFFSHVDSVVAKLEISGLDTVYSLPITLLAPKAYHSTLSESIIINGVKHIIIDDFDELDRPGAEYSKVSGADPSPDQKDSQTSFGTDTQIKVEGASSYAMQGQDDNNNGWSGGINSEFLIDFYKVASTEQLLIDSGINPEKLYFNVFIYGTGYANTSVQLKVYEQDPQVLFDDALGANVTMKSREEIRHYYQDNTPVPVYDQANNDGYIYNIDVFWTGWKLVSVPYSKFNPNNDPLTGGGGDRVKESWRVAGMAVSLLSNPATGAFTKTYVDLLSVTQGGPFQR